MDEIINTTNVEPETKNSNAQVTDVNTEVVSVSPAEDTTNDAASNSSDDENVPIIKPIPQPTRIIPKDAIIGQNIILYGVPGCGKSHTIANEYCNDKEYDYPITSKRVVFHPDYAYADFVGQILPQTTSSSSIAYEFVAGPFTAILKEAIENPGTMYFLIIEEINRGNAPAIFGDVFQLLDRDNTGKSKYSIKNTDIATHIYMDEIDGSEASINATKNKDINIPANLTILATMNSADQNVFTLDTAFKRRWIMRCIKNDIRNCDYRDEYICSKNVTWSDFVEKINKEIIELSKGNFSNEDHRLGAFFVREEDLTDTKLFGEKVLMYLWCDVFKYNREAIFKPEYKTLEDLLTGFEENQFEVFNEDLSFDNTDYIPGSTLPGASGKKSTINLPDTYFYPTSSGYKTTIDLYEQIRSTIKKQIEALGTDEFIPCTTQKKPYIKFANKNGFDKRASGREYTSFAEFTMQKATLTIAIEPPITPTLSHLGKTTIDKNLTHPFRIKIKSSTANTSPEFAEVIKAIMESYNTVKK